MMAGRRIEVRGTVQGVGFRPWVVRVAKRSGVTGRVRNHGRGVTIEAFGSKQSLWSFLEELQADMPPAARVFELRAEPIPEEELLAFEILPSKTEGDKALSIPADLATCP